MKRFAHYYFWISLFPLLLAVLLAYYPDPFFPLHGGPFEFLPLLQETMASSGVTLRGGALIPLLSAVGSEPVLVIAALGSCIPALVAIAFMFASGGWRGVARLFGRLRPWLGDIGLAEGAKTWLLLAATVVVVQLSVFLVQIAVSGPAGWTVSFNPSLFTPLVVFFFLEAMFLNQGGLLEELGLRGYALPLLQSRFTPIIATLILGVSWAIWHIPRDILFQTIPAMGLAPYLAVYLPLFALWCVGGSIIMTFFVNRTGGSALAAVAVHGFLNDGLMLSGVVEGGGGATPVLQMVIRSFVVAGAGLIVFLIAGRNLGMRPEGEAARNL